MMHLISRTGRTLRHGAPSALLLILSAVCLAGGAATDSSESDYEYAPGVPSYMSNEDDSRTVAAVVDSFVDLRTRIRERLPKANGRQSDSLFLAYYRYAAYHLFPILWHPDGRFINEYAYYNGDTAKLPAGTSKIVRLLRKNGIGIDGFGIGSRQIYFTNKHLYTMFGRYVSEDLRLIIQLKEHDDARPFEAGCSFGISFEEVGNRVAAWESFLIKYPKSRYAPMARKWYCVYLHAFTHGGDNNAIVIGTHDTTDMAPMYRAYVSKRPGSESARVVERLLSFREATGNEHNDGLDSVLKIDCEDVNASDFE
jgi:hypothetical protein